MYAFVSILSNNFQYCLKTLNYAELLGERTREAAFILYLSEHDF